MLEFVNVDYSYGSVPAVQNLSFMLAEGEVSVLVGPSGCGKSTTLRLVNRLLEPTSGTVYYQGQPLRDFEPEALRRSMGYSIQGVGLFPHWTVAQNVAAVPRLLGWSPKRCSDRTKELLEVVGLDPVSFCSKFPAELSGGEAQRVGIARALAADPPLLLMDEPFGAVDVLQRHKLQQVLLSIQKKVKKTILLITHDLDEAILLADRLLVLRQGRIAQEGPPAELLRSPASDFVREFFGLDRAFKRLIRFHASDFVEPLDEESRLTFDEGASLSSETNLRDALSLMLAQGKETLLVKEGSRILGLIRKSSLEALAAEEPRR
ncbi:MAG: ABC transporter ATP-binding protein [Spirochaetales bacterium]|nr:ABC transporter ATP-binding protein [Spirochaetales bacterium]